MFHVLLQILSVQYVELYLKRLCCDIPRKIPHLLRFYLVERLFYVIYLSYSNIYRYLHIKRL